MNILFIAPYVPSRIRVRPYHFVRELGRHHQVSVLAVGSDERDSAAIAELRDVCASVETMPLRRAPMLRSLMGAGLRRQPLQSAVCYSPELGNRVASLWHSGRFDVVHVEHLRAARVRADLPPETPTVFDSVDSISLLLERTLHASHSLPQRGLSLIELGPTRRYEARLVGQFGRVVVTSAVDARRLLALNPAARMCVIPNGVDLEHFRPAQVHGQPPTIVFSGKMSYHANASAILHFAKDILPLIRARRPDVQVRIVGSGPTAAVRALAEIPGVTVTGHVPDMRDELARATLAVSPMTVKVGIQNKVLESMAMGLPVVCSPLGAEGIDAQDGRDFLVANDVAAFARLVCEMVDDPERRDAMGQAARRYVETNHQWSTAAETLAGLYAEQVAAAPATRSQPHNDA